MSPAAMRSLLFLVLLSVTACTCNGNRLKMVEMPEPMPEPDAGEMPMPCVASAEVCDGKDNDCDGAIDEDLMMQQCGMGECGSVQPTCKNGAPAQCPAQQGSAEVCDGKDNDCNGSVDEGLVANLSSDKRVTNNPSASDFVYAGWSGSQFGLVWQDKRDSANGDIYFAALDKLGERLSPTDRRVTSTTGVTTHPALAWNGTNYGLVYGDDTPGNLELYFQLLKEDGTPVGTAKRLTNATRNSDWPDVVWTGQKFVVVWEDERSGAAKEDVWLQVVNADGSMSGNAVQVTNSAGREMDPVLKVGANELAVVWTDTRFTQREIYFRRMSFTGQLLGGEVRVSNDGADSAWPDLAWNGTDWAVVWHDTRDGNSEIYLAKVSKTGQKLGNDVRLTSADGNSGYPSIDWNGFEYGVSWQDDRAGNNAIYFTQVSEAGVKNGADLKVTTGAGASTFTTALWNGVQFAVSWRDDRDANTELYFAYIGCPP